MIENGFDPHTGGKTTRRNKAWLEFINRHLELMSASDFFTTEVMTIKGLVRYLIFFVIECSTKKVKLVHISDSFYGAKMEIIARTMTDPYDVILEDKKYFFYDKDVLNH